MEGGSPSPGPGLRRLSRAAGAAVALAGLVVLCGWAVRVDVLKSLVPGLATMKANTALGFLLVGVSLLLSTLPPARASIAIARGAAILAAVLGAVVLAEYLFGWEAGIDQLLFADPGNESAHPGRMSPLTATGFLLLGAGLGLLDARDRHGNRPAHLLALTASVIGFTALVGYVFSLASLYRIKSYTSMALHTSIAFLTAGLGVVAARAEGGLPALLASRGPGGMLARRLIPATFLGVAALGWFVLAQERAGAYSSEVAIGLMVIATIVFLTIFVYATAQGLERATERHGRAEAAIHESEKRKRAILDAALDAVITIDAEGRVLEFNRAAEELFGYSTPEAQGREMAELIVPPELRDRHRRGLARNVATGQSRVLGHRVELPAMTRGGRRFPAEIAITRIETGGAPLYTGYVRDLSDRVQAEEDLRESGERFRLLARATSDIIWDWNLQNDRIWWNEGVQTLLGYDPAEAGADPFWWSRHVDPSDVDRVRRGMQEALKGTGSAWEDEYTFFRSDGSPARVLDRGFIIRDGEGRATRMIGATVDITERRQLEAQLRQSQKMEAVGQLAGGLAHDFNNILTAVLGYVDLLEAKVREDPESTEFVSEIRKAGEAAAAMTRRLLVFSRHQLVEPMVLDVNAVIRDLEKMARRLITENIELVTALDPNLGSVLADAGQMQQVMMNLLVNARDAMPKGGQLTVETSNTALDDTYAARHAGVRPGAYVMVAVTDTGVGMDAATQARIFEPFFTTKSPDKGTGLGLSTVYGIVKQSGGHLWVYSEVGKGTTVKIYLPRAKGAPAEKAAPERIASGGATGTILLVEDDAVLRRLTRRILGDLGYTVLEAENGRDALDVANGYSERIDLMLSDVVMPGMGAADLAEELRRRRPETRVLFMSGYADDAIVRHRVLEAGTAFLQKPFTPSSLGEKLREVLAAPAAEIPAKNGAASRASADGVS